MRSNRGIFWYSLGLTLLLLLPMVLVWYILTELGSILENAAAMGAPVPEFLIRILANAKDTVEDAAGEA